jgi:hypothetical protein
MKLIDDIKADELTLLSAIFEKKQLAVFLLTISAGPSPQATWLI